MIGWLLVVAWILSCVAVWYQSRQLDKEIEATSQAIDALDAAITRLEKLAEP